MSIKVRFPPSPTGYCHVGTARMAVLNYLFARKHGGTIVFRSEDTDKERSKREFEEDIIEQLHWLGLDWDEFYRTTELVENHKKAMLKLVEEDKAYVSEEESKKVPGTMAKVVRLRNPGKIITFTDEIRGEITFDTTELQDFAIGRAIDDPLYHLAVVVDDALQGITHVIRGEDHISNTPRQILIQEALGYARPVYAHYPLHLGSDKSKLSKRTGDVAVRSYREKGFLPAALLNYIAVLGWSPPSGKEILTLAEMITEFELKDLHKSGAVFDLEKLLWFNKQYMNQVMSAGDDHIALGYFKDALEKSGVVWDEAIGKKVLPILIEHIYTWHDIHSSIETGDFIYFFKDPSPHVDDIPQKGSGREVASLHLKHVAEVLEKASDADFESPDQIKQLVWDYASEKGRGEVLWPLRFSLSGRAKSPDPFVIASIIGKESTLRRVRSAIGALTS